MRQHFVIDSTFAALIANSVGVIVINIFARCEPFFNIMLFKFASFITPDVESITNTL